MLNTISALTSLLALPPALIILKWYKPPRDRLTLALWMATHINSWLQFSVYIACYPISFNIYRTYLANAPQEVSTVLMPHSTIGNYFVIALGGIFVVEFPLVVWYFAWKVQQWTTTSGKKMLFLVENTGSLFWIYWDCVFPANPCWIFSLCCLYSNGFSHFCCKQFFSPGNYNIVPYTVHCIIDIPMPSMEYWKELLPRMWLALIPLHWKLWHLGLCFYAGCSCSRQLNCSSQCQSDCNFHHVIQPAWTHSLHCQEDILASHIANSYCRKRE